MSPLLWHASKHEWHASLGHCWPNRDSSAPSMCSSVSAGSLSRTSTGQPSGIIISLVVCVQVDSDKVMAALAALQRWAEDRGLKRSEADYQDLQFTADGDAEAEHACPHPLGGSTDVPAPVVERPRRSPSGVAILSFPQSVGMRILRRHRPFPFQGQRRRAVP